MNVVNFYLRGFANFARGFGMNYSFSCGAGTGYAGDNHKQVVSFMLDVVEEQKTKKAFLSLKKETDKEKIRRQQAGGLEATSKDIETIKNIFDSEILGIKLSIPEFCN